MNEDPRVDIMAAYLDMISVEFIPACPLCRHMHKWMQHNT